MPGLKIKKSEFICKYCNMWFANRSDRSMHVCSLWPFKTEFRCSQCYKYFKCDSELQKHLASHSLERPFVCDYCGKDYKHKRNLAAHLKSAHQVAMKTYDVVTKVSYAGIDQPLEAPTQEYTF